MKAEKLTVFDGQTYKPGEIIHDLGSFVAVETSADGKKRSYEGLSKDVEKLPHYVVSGSSALCLDTGDYYKYHEPTDTWYLL